MNHRLNLFKKFYISSLSNQLCKNFNIILLIDKNTPFDTYSIIKELTESIPCKSKIYMDKKTDIVSCKSEIIEFLKLNYYGKIIITTRIDNDDAVSKDFISEIQNNLKDTNTLLNFNIGYSCDYKQNYTKYYLTKQNSNPFISLSELVTDEIKTVYVKSTRATFLDSSDSWAQCCKFFSKKL
jgi:hypothetical protein